ncbi:hypothetical protein A1O3_00105 [Capronia epimyces CBS 606.96]|uniref:Alpha/beta hydrolase fold-3 domain-containing protein n=1 Tax=Capronia epimyces CBS 606.96 TaxID=1182542 RepID=W9YF94_9EURO|nr:uncharacterized protein A1O3_00105 [Capronia epimyces CBS 606.96]EXJ91557.1 hypothetical protein A1O3_00105 [Capronia epimyces CBS 606.96]
MAAPLKGMIPSDCVYDLKAFDPASTSAQTAQLNRDVISAAEKDEKWWKVGAQVYREMRAKGQTVFPPYTLNASATNVEVPSREAGRRINCRLIKPSNASVRPQGIFLHIHGGGWVLGTAQGQDRLLSHIADQTGLLLLSVEYRLAPEHIYPAAREDCEDVVDWLTVNAQATLNADLWFIGGESAGATLSVLALLHLKEQGKANGIKGALLSYGCYDLSILPSLKLAPNSTPVLSLEDSERFFAAYLPGLSLEDRKDRAVSPAYNDLAGLCPALFLVGTEDALVDDTVLMHFRWLRAGNQAVLRFVPGAPHGFTLFDASSVEVTASGWQSIVDFTQNLL